MKAQALHHMVLPLSARSWHPGKRHCHYPHSTDEVVYGAQWCTPVTPYLEAETRDLQIRAQPGQDSLSKYKIKSLGLQLSEKP